MLTESIFNQLERKYGQHASWAVWNPASLSDSQIISKNLDSLKTSVVMVGLNYSQPLAKHSWSNFHMGRHDRKLMNAFNDSSYRGAYMTDIFKVAVAKAGELLARIKSGEINAGKHISYFHDEMKELRVEDNALFILFGQDVERVFTDYLSRYYPNFVGCPHYSNYGKGFSDTEYVGKLWDKLEGHYRRTKLRFNTPEFIRPLASI